MIIASSYAFRKLIGIDYSASLCKQAVSNLRKCSVPEERFDISCVDATEFVFPDGNLFLFFYNPFDDTIIRRVLENLRGHKGRLVIGFIGQFRGELANHDWLLPISKGGHSDVYEGAHPMVQLQK